MKSSEIKFRVWNKKTNCFIKDANNNMHFDVWTWAEQMSSCLSFPINDYVFQRYIGLNDCDKIPIYEGDIVFLNKWKKHGSCEFFDAEFRFAWKIIDGTICRMLEIKRFVDYIGEISSVSEDDEILLVKEKIVGNVFENPELLK